MKKQNIKTTKETPLITNLLKRIKWPKASPDAEQCSCCNGPFHESTGHLVLHKDGKVRFRICGICYGEILPHLKRSWGGERFYDHAGPIPAEAPFGWRPEDVF